ncbi:MULTISPECIES: hypothetical protein [Burkholderia]|uniref:hypothetical protein n=1 Tax=Burkholderia TaxID=32008 RepID=UPI000980F1BF|nr:MULTISPECIES: hypothetical protein [Burkholderia]AQQ43864.1 hypothetical protein A8E75_33810 [Burkholderia cenocepacia]MBG0881052.1 hypothetical protein [Burkholderia sp. 9775_39]MBG0885243.1 hypothetical protein [Burkholderia sp. 9773_38]ONV22271.1 hypothetical protein A8E78_32130 [Burkholderia cenocepacia]ONV25012.1 hypothetical protein A8E74_10860 [Burkholderia cenocepacia]
MQKANVAGAGAIDPAHRTDGSIRSDGEPADQSAPASLPVRFGVLQGQVRIADDFDAPLPDYLLDAFEGR